MDRRPFLRGVLACLAGLLLSAAAQAQAFRTYLSSSGVDNPTCAVTAPCRLLPAALAAVADGGEVWILDSVNYNTGPVSVTKSVTILAVPGALGSVVALGGDAIVIATAGVKVTLRNLVIVPYLGSGGSGINMTAGAALTVQDCLIANLAGSGIVVNTAATVRVTDTTIRDNVLNGIYVLNGARAFVTGATISGNGGVGIYVRSSFASTTIADIADSTIEANNFGVYAYASAGNTARVSVSDSWVVGQGSAGLTVQSVEGGAAALSAGNNRVSNNGHGIVAAGASAKVWVSGNVVSNNGIGFVAEAGTIFESAGDNAVRNNVTNSLGVITPISPM